MTDVKVESEEAFLYQSSIKNGQCIYKAKMRQIYL